MSKPDGAHNSISRLVRCVSPCAAGTGERRRASADRAGRALGTSARGAACPRCAKRRPEAEPRLGFAFIHRNSERRLLMLTPRDPYDTRPRSFTPRQIGINRWASPGSDAAENDQSTAANTRRVPPLALAPQAKICVLDKRKVSLARDPCPRRNQ